MGPYVCARSRKYSNTFSPSSENRMLRCEYIEVPPLGGRFLIIFWYVIQYQTARPPTAKPVGSSNLVAMPQWAARWAQVAVQFLGGFFFCRVLAPNRI